MDCPCRTENQSEHNLDTSQGSHPTVVYGTRESGESVVARWELHVCVTGSKPWRPGSHKKFWGNVESHVDGLWVAANARAIGEDAKLEQSIAGTASASSKP